MTSADESAPRPTVTLKIATSLDGRIATASGESKWITGEAAREEVHRLRAAHDAVLVGSQTVLDDDPELTVRLPGYEGPQPLRVVADARLRTPPEARLFATASPRTQVVIATAEDDAEDAFTQKILSFLSRISDVHPAPKSPDEERFVGFMSCRPGAGGYGLDPVDLITTLVDLEISSVLLEGGGKLAASFLRAGLIDRIEWFRAPIVLGGDAKPAVAALELGKLADAPRFKRVDVKEVGDDLWERYERAE